MGRVVTGTVEAEFRAVAPRRGPLVAWLLALAAGIGAMLWLGQGHLATPPLTDTEAWTTWFAQRDPLIAAMALFRLLVLALAWYLVGVTAVSLVAHVAQAARLVRLADALSVPLVRHLTQQAVGLALATAAVASVSHAPDASSLAPPVAAGADVSATVGTQTLAMESLSPGTLAMRAEVATGAEGITMRRDDVDTSVVTGGVDEAYTLRMARLTPSADDSAEAPSVEHASPTGPRDAATVEVRPGDHLWSIAERALARSWGRSPSDREVEPYWREVIAENRDRLSNPEDPDLLLPGQVLMLPDTPPAP